MVLSISPGAKDDDTKLSILKINSKNGKITSPMRAVNRNDISAKEALGSNLHLAKFAKSFCYELPLNMNDVLSILNNEKYIEKYEKKILDFIDRFRTNGSLFLLYPTVTIEAYQSIIQNDFVKLFARRICEFIKKLGLECVILPTFNKIEVVAKEVQKNDLQYIPRINIKNDPTIVDKEFTAFDGFDCSNSPIVGINFCTYLDAEDQYKKIIKKFDHWHERNKAIITFGAERKLPNCNNVSGVHYPTVIYGDLVVEKFSRYFGGDKKKKKIQTKIGNQNKSNPNLVWFDKNELKFSKIDKNNIDPFLDSIKTGIDENRLTRDLLYRIVTDQLNPDDIKNRREGYLNRLDENDSSRPDFKTFQDRIDNNEAKEYIDSKKGMCDILKKHLKLN